MPNPEDYIVYNDPMNAPRPYGTGTTSSYNPETGATNYSEFQYTPTPPRPPPDVMMQNLSRMAAEAFSKLPTADAERAVSAAIRFQGMRGYRNALAAGKPADEALTEYAPLLFYKNPSAMGTGIKALRPQPQFKWTPGEGTRPGAFMAPGQRPMVPSAPRQPVVLQEIDALQQMQREAQEARASGNFALEQDRLNRAAMLQNQLREKKLTPEQKLDRDILLGDLVAARKRRADAMLPSQIKQADAELQTAKHAIDVFRKSIGEAAAPDDSSGRPSPVPRQRLSEMVAGPAEEEPKKVKNKAEFDALPSGAVYIGKDGKKYRKP